MSPLCLKSLASTLSRHGAVVSVSALSVVLALAACSSGVGGAGGAGFSGGSPGSPCDSSFQTIGCTTLVTGGAVQYLTVSCDGGTWVQTSVCAAGQICTESFGGGGVSGVQCVDQPTGGGGGGGADTTGGGGLDASTGDGDTSGGGDDASAGGDDSSGGGGDIGGGGGGGGVAELLGCLQTSCGAEVAACLENPACAVVVSCVSGCGAGPCLDGCLAQAGPDAQQLLGPILACAAAEGCGDLTSPSCGDGLCFGGETEESCPADCNAGVGEPVCGDGSCDAPDENDESCPEDCSGGGEEVCGNGVCEGPEAETCPQDCGGGGEPVCGNGSCEVGETSVTCPDDCGGAGDGCTNGDVGWMTQNEGQTSNSEKVTAVAQGCGLECGGNASCVNSCLKAAEFPLTDGCLGCFGAASACALEKCATPCAFNPSNDQCVSCQLELGCIGALLACTKLPAPQCGNGACELGETAGLCAVDCASGPICGNDVCEDGETTSTCPGDCPPGAVCGNQQCEAGENQVNCPVDCASAPQCGNGQCEAGESAATCPADCGGSSGKDQCLNVQDQIYLQDIQPDGQTGFATAQAAASECALTCLQTPDPDVCTASCMLNQQGVPLSEGCAGCYGQIVLCSIQECAAQCIADSSAPVCTDCLGAKGCTPAFEDCSGLPFQNNGGGGGAVCGNGQCESGESAASCPADCGGGGGSHVCDASNACGGKHPSYDCYCDSACKNAQDCCSANGLSLASSCAGSTCSSCN